MAYFPPTVETTKVQFITAPDEKRLSNKWFLTKFKTLKQTSLNRNANKLILPRTLIPQNHPCVNQVKKNSGFGSFFKGNVTFRPISHENKTVAWTTLCEFKLCACAVQPTPALRLSGQSAWGEVLGVDPSEAVLLCATSDQSTTMSKPKFQTEWEEIDGEYQQLQVSITKNTALSRAWAVFAAPARHGWRRHSVAVQTVLLWIAPLRTVRHSFSQRT